MLNIPALSNEKLTRVYQERIKSDFADLIDPGKIIPEVINSISKRIKRLTLDLFHQGFDSPQATKGGTRIHKKLFRGGKIYMHHLVDLLETAGIQVVRDQICTINPNEEITKKSLSDLKSEINSASNEEVRINLIRKFIVDKYSNNVQASSARSLEGSF